MKLPKFCYFSFFFFYQEMEEWNVALVAVFLRIAKDSNLERSNMFGFE